MMMKYIFRVWMGLLVTLMVAMPATADPGTKVAMRSQLLVSDDGLVTGLRLQWTTDPDYASDALENFTPQADGSYSAEDLAKLTDENLEALNSYHYFVDLRFDGKTLDIGKGFDGAQTYDPAQKQLTLNFSLPLKSPIDPRRGGLALRIYDPEQAIDFVYVKDNPFDVSKALPQGCSAVLHPPPSEADRDAANKLMIAKGEGKKPSDGAAFGASLAQLAEVKCSS